MSVKKISVVFSLFSFMLLSPVSSIAADLYASPGAVGDCSAGNPCAVQTALNTAGTNGQDDIIYLTTGTYDASGGTFTYDSTIWNPSENYALTIIGQGAGVSIIDGGNSNQGMYIITQGISDDSNAHVLVEEISFQNGKSPGYGGGIRIFTQTSNVMVKECDFEGNIAESFSGGGINVTSNDGNITFTNNSFSENEAGDYGGGAYAWSGSGFVTLTNNTFVDNSSERGGGAYGFSRLNTIILTNNIFTANIANGISNENGGGTYAGSLTGPITITNNTFSDNTANNFGGGVYVMAYGNDAVVNIYNNVVWNNAAGSDFGDDIYVEDDGNLDQEGSPVNLYNNDYNDFVAQKGNNLSQNNNISQTPGLTADFHLQADSPCIDNGDNDAPSLPATDFERDNRIVDGDRDSVATVDIGADEYVTRCFPWILFIPAIQSGAQKGN